MFESQSYVCEEAQRLDIFLSEKIGQTRSQIANLIKLGYVHVANKKVARPGLKLKVGQSVLVEFPEAIQEEGLDVDFDVEILYEDEDVLVINKPSGLTVHPAPSVKEATLVDWLKHKDIRLSTISGEERHGIVHRLDKGTSGAMVVAKNNESHEFLSHQLQDKSMGRYYLAIINPPLKDRITTIDKKIRRSTHNRLKMACAAEGKEAKTQFSVLLHSDDETKQLIACKLFTGRTHQIRVHLESINRHILGDHIYGVAPKLESPERILLHAYIIYFIHPRTKKRISFVANLDRVMKEYIEKKFTMEKVDEVLQTTHIFDSFNTDS